MFIVAIVDLILLCDSKDVDVDDDCSRLDASCVNGTRAVDTGHSCECQCPAGFSGDQCQTCKVISNIKRYLFEVIILCGYLYLYVVFCYMPLCGCLVLCGFLSLCDYLSLCGYVSMCGYLSLCGCLSSRGYLSLYGYLPMMIKVLVAS